MATRTITGNILDLTDAAVASGTVTFEKLVTSTTGNTIHQGGVDTATTDGNGDFSIDLAVPASGSYRYRMILPNGWSFYFSIAAGASVNVATLIIAETIEDSDAIVEALAAYLPLSGGTMTGQLNFSGTTHAGIKLLPLTTTQRDALTPANGMVIYNSTTATAQVYQGGAWVSVGTGDTTEYIIVALSDETTALATGTAKATFVMPYAMTLTGVIANVNTAPTGSALQVDINESGVSILSTKLTIDATEDTSATAATPAVISDSALASGSKIIFDIDAVGSVVAGAGLKVTLIGTR